MKIAISELEHLRQEVMKNYQIIEEMQKKRPWVGLTKEAVELNEPVISAWSLREVYFDENGEPLMHRSPPAAQRPWLSLTGEEIDANQTLRYHFSLNNGPVTRAGIAVVETIEAMLKAKNHG